MEIKIREKSSGIIYSSKFSEKDHSICRIDFSYEYADFIVQDRDKKENGEFAFKTKTLRIYDKSTFKKYVRFAFSSLNSAEWVKTK
jgi:hypothetical protein